MTAASAGADLQTLLELLGGEPRERITIGFLPTGDDKPRFKATRAGDVDAVAGSLRDLDCSYSAQPLGYVNGGRGDARDVTGIRELYADLDAKPDGMPTSKAACAVITDLSSMLGAAPVAVVSTGHGLQPHWRIERYGLRRACEWLAGPLPAQLPTPGSRPRYFRHVPSTTASHARYPVRHSPCSGTVSDTPESS